MTSIGKQQAVKAGLIWEFCWLPFEMIAVGTSLWLSLKFQWLAVGSVWLVAFLAIDFVVRYQHYSKVAPTIHGPQLER